MIVGIAGPKKSGKTTLANSLAETYGLNHLSFAAPIRLFVASILGVPLDELERIKERPISWLDGITPRTIMQRCGTEFGRNMVHPEIWVRRVLRLASLERGAVISDVRFQNEAQAIRRMGGVIIRVNRAGCDPEDTHTSESPLPDSLVDFELTNNGTPEGMAAQASVLLQDHIRAFRAAKAMGAA
jgi:hypothetical protein